jgi:hypothetical protein
MIAVTPQLPVPQPINVPTWSDWFSFFVKQKMTMIPQEVHAILSRVLQHQDSVLR